MLKHFNESMDTDRSGSGDDEGDLRACGQLTLEIFQLFLHVSNISGELSVLALNFLQLTVKSLHDGITPAVLNLNRDRHLLFSHVL